MINSVPIKIMEASRTVVLRHPNSIDCEIYRKVLLRTADESMGGMPTLGGMGVLKSEDEEEFEYQALGPAKIHLKGAYEGDDMVDRADAMVPDVSLSALIECVNVPGFEIKKGDLVAVMPGGGVVIGYEIVGRTSSVNIYPYTTTWIVSPRDELHHLEPWKTTP